MHLTVLRLQGQSKVTEMARHILWLANGPGLTSSKILLPTMRHKWTQQQLLNTQNDPLEMPSPRVSVSHWQLYPE